MIKRLLLFMLVSGSCLGAGMVNGTLSPVGGSSSGTSSTNYVVATNTTVVNGIFPAYTVNTNILYVSGAGSNIVNQTYTWDGISGVYTNPVNVVQLKRFGGFFWLTNSTLNIKYYRCSASSLNTLLPITFSINGGGVGGQPLPTALLGTNAPTYTTNNSSITRSTLPINAPNGSFVFVSLGGNDTTAIRGSTDFAYATMATAVTNMQPGDVMYLDYGTFYAANLNFPSQSACIGRGALLTTVICNTNGTSSQDRSFLFTNQINQFGLLKDFTWATTNQSSVPNLQSIASYVGTMEFRNLIILGDSDGLNPISSDGPSTANLYDCKIYSAFDQIAMSTLVAQNVNLYNCDLSGLFGYRSSSWSSFVRGIVSGNAPVNMYGGSITESNSATETTCIENNGGASYPVNLFGVSLNVGSTNGGTSTFSFNSFPVNMMGCLTNGGGYLYTLPIAGSGLGITNVLASGLVLTNITLNPIVSGGYWTNTNSFTGTLTVNGTLTDAVSGDPGLNMTNIISGEFCNATSSLAVAGLIPFTATFRMAVNDYFLATNQSSGSGGSTIKSSSFRP